MFSYTEYIDYSDFYPHVPRQGFWTPPKGCLVPHQPITLPQIAREFQVVIEVTDPMHNTTWRLSEWYDMDTDQARFDTRDNDHVNSSVIHVTKVRIISSDE